MDTHSTLAGRLPVLIRQWAAVGWMQKLPPAEFAEKIGSMSYTQGIATAQSDPDTTKTTEKETTV